MMMIRYASGDEQEQEEEESAGNWEAISRRGQQEHKNGGNCHQNETKEGGNGSKECGSMSLASRIKDACNKQNERSVAGLGGN